jgi:Tannase and feruloyl esterase
LPSKKERFWSSAKRHAAGRWQLAAVACIAAILSAVLLPCGGARAVEGLAVMPVMNCAAVASLDLTGATDAPVTIQSATVVAAGAPTGAAGASTGSTGTLAPYCDVKGTIAPADMFELQLPTQGWTQRYLQTGCGGLCGQVAVNYTEAATCPPVANGTIASATTDMGHEGQNDGSWAANNPQAQIDFAYRSMHTLAQTSKAIITKFYGQAPKYSYFDGCSDGGREALMEAQRYPDDIDGIAAGAPANDLVVQNTFHHGWNVLANLDANGNCILLANRLPLIHQAVLAACDGLDGVVDEVIDDPRRCQFDPDTLLCVNGQDPTTCLSEAEVAVVCRLHEGPTDPLRHHLEQPIAYEWGSELD